MVITRSLSYRKVSTFPLSTLPATVRLPWPMNRSTSSNRLSVVTFSCVPRTFVSTWFSSIRKSHWWISVRRMPTSWRLSMPSVWKPEMRTFLKWINSRWSAWTYRQKCLGTMLPIARLFSRCWPWMVTCLWNFRKQNIRRWRKSMISTCCAIRSLHPIITFRPCRLPQRLPRSKCL